MSEIRVLIVEDEPVIAENIAQYLNNNDFTVAGIAYDSEEATNILENDLPDAVILDINLDSDLDGIEIAQLINERYHLPFVFLTSYADKATIERAKTVTPWGYIVTPFNENTILATLEMTVSNFARASQNEIPELNLVTINSHLSSPISEREFEVLKFIYDGATNRQIADSLFVSLNTIKKHINSAYFKLDTTSRSLTIVRLRELMMK